MIPQEELRKCIPYQGVQNFPGGLKPLVSLRSLLTAKGRGGTIYYSRFKQPVAINGQTKIIGFFQHAIDRTCERIVSGCEAYTGLGDASAFLDQCVRFERSDLPDGQWAFTFYDRCRKGGFSWRYVEEVLGWDIEDDGHYYRRIGYCPAVIEGDFLVARTLLLPGHRNTPEHRLVWASDLSVREKKSLGNTAWGQATEDFRLVKFFHQRGVPQVVHDERENVPLH